MLSNAGTAGSRTETGDARGQVNPQQGAFASSGSCVARSSSAVDHGGSPGRTPGPGHP